MFTPLIIKLRVHYQLARTITINAQFMVTASKETVIYIHGTNLKWLQKRPSILPDIQLQQ